MTLPVSHKIVVIDDNYDEVVDLLRLFGKNGVSYIHFTGKENQLPSIPLSGIRVVFSDINLSSTRDDKTKVSTLIGVLRKIIAKDNGPYIIVFWTGHSDFIEQIKQSWDKQGVPPLKYLCIEKTDCKDAAGNFSVELIEAKIKEQIRDFQAFNFYLEWENTLVKTGEDFIAKFHKLIPENTDWSRCIYYFLHKMYSAVVGKKAAEKHSDPEKFIIACQLFNKSFNNELDHSILPLSNNHKLIQNTREPIDQTSAISAINQFLWIHKINAGNISAGDVFIEEKPEIKKNMIDKILKEANRGDTRIRLAKVIITPLCDIAQNKLISDTEKGNLHRVVYAIIVPCTVNQKSDNELWHYKFGPFILEEENVFMHFHFGTVGFEYLADRKENPIFSIKQEIVFDIQSKIANHMNRLGNSLLS